MDKQTILNELTANGQISVFRRSPSWEKAFNLYQQKTGHRKSMDCGTCFRDILSWLRQG